MKMARLYFTISLCAAALFTFQSCKKESSLGIDNDRVITTPYVVYAASSKGTVIKSNDGERFDNMFPPDGYPVDLIFTSGKNVLFLKENLYVSENNGKNFSPTYSNVEKYPWASMVFDMPSFNRLYITSKGGFGGIVYSEDKGKSWKIDTAFDEGIVGGAKISSFANLNGALFGYSNAENKIFEKTSATGNWSLVVPDTPIVKGNGQYYLVANETTLFLVDHRGKEGVWYSTDRGMQWRKLGQGTLPKNINWNCAVSPDGGNSLIVGTDSMGLYKTDGTAFEAASSGLKKGTSVFGMTYKTNTYKNDVVRPYLYVATNDGIYRSEDKGETWHKVTYGVFDLEYTTIY